MKKNTIKFNLSAEETIVNVKRLVGVINKTQLNKHIVYSYLKAMASTNFIPKSYLSRVDNKNTSFISASKYVQSKIDSGFEYRIDAVRLDSGDIILALIKLHIPSEVEESDDFRKDSWGFEDHEKADEAIAEHNANDYAFHM